MKAFLTLTGAFIGYFFLEGFTRIIIMFYHRDEFQYYGISHLPGHAWSIIILAGVLVITWLLCMVVLSVLREKPALYASLFGSILLLWRSFEIANSHHSEPAWYLISVVHLHLLGTFLAYKLYVRNYEAPSPS